MRLFKLGMVLAVLCMLTSYASADTLVDAFKAGKINGGFTLYYEGAADVSSTVPGGGVVNMATCGSGTCSGNQGLAGLAFINYVSGKYKGLQTGVSFRATHDFSIDDDNVPSRLALSSAKMQQFWLKYSLKANSVQVGRQMIMTPLLWSGPGPFPQWDSADAVVLTTKAIPNTEIKLIAMNEWVPRDAEGSYDSNAVHFSDPLYSLYIKNNSVKNLTLIGQYMTTDEDFDDQGLTNVPPPLSNSNGDMPAPTTEAYDVTYLEAIYNFATETPFTLKAQYSGVNYDTADDSGFFAAQVKTKLAGFGLRAAYSKVEDDNNHPGVYGHRPSYMYTAIIIMDPLNAGQESIVIGGDYAFKNGLKTAVDLAFYSDDVNDSLDGMTAIQLGLHYKFSGALDGFSAGIITDYMTFDQTLAGGDDDVIYTRANLDFRF
ncbi:MAG: hypothetical protein PF495_10725 [Spirochaetales bacterium]|jgi:hypothetical protein|nr:hypothetical protein [Spirochaetales bacterium]